MSSDVTSLITRDGPFAKVWLAGTSMTEKGWKKSVLQTNICQLVDAIQEDENLLYLLRISSILLKGFATLHMRKCGYVMQQANSVISRMKLVLSKGNTVLPFEKLQAAYESITFTGTKREAVSRDLGEALSSLFQVPFLQNPESFVILGSEVEAPEGISAQQPLMESVIRSPPRKRLSDVLRIGMEGTPLLDPGEFMDFQDDEILNSGLRETPSRLRESISSRNLQEDEMLVDEIGDNSIWPSSEQDGTPLKSIIEKSSRRKSGEGTGTVGDLFDGIGESGLVDFLRMTAESSRSRSGRRKRSAVMVLEDSPQKPAEVRRKRKGVKSDLVLVEGTNQLLREEMNHNFESTGDTMDKGRASREAESLWREKVELSHRGLLEPGLPQVLGLLLDKSVGISSSFVEEQEIEVARGDSLSGDVRGVRDSLFESGVGEKDEMIGGYATEFMSSQDEAFEVPEVRASDLDVESWGSNSLRISGAEELFSVEQLEPSDFERISVGDSNVGSEMSEVTKKVLSESEESLMVYGMVKKKLNEKGELDLDDLIRDRPSRKVAASVFSQLLKFDSNDIVNLEQEEPYSRIGIIPSLNL